MNFIDKFLNNITMYRLLLYLLLVLVGVAFTLSFFQQLPFTPLALLFSTAFLVAACWVTNRVFAFVFKGPTNLESVYITALILALIITPTTNLHQLPLLFWASVLAISSKYILAIGKKHLFNPVAFGVFATSVGIGQAASWWVGTSIMLPIVLIAGLLIIRKIRHFDLVFSFLIISSLSILGYQVFIGEGVLITLQKIYFETPLLFFAFIMLTEPQTTPPTRKFRVIYGSLVGLLFSPAIHIGGYFFTPESALLVGNIFSYLVSPREKLILNLKEKVLIGKDTYDFVFTPSKKLNYKAGQYLEWTLGYPHPDSRGNRRYFTLASAPTENELRIGVKFYPNSSNYKKALFNLGGGEIVASQLSGEFTMPEDPSKKLVFVAGGIGITPFRSMLKYLLDTNQRRDVVIFYSNNTKEEIVYPDVFNAAAEKLGIKTIYTLTDTKSAPVDWTGKVGFVTAEMIRGVVPDFKERLFYISGPHSLVTTFEKILGEIGVPKAQIKIDFFPGYA